MKYENMGTFAFPGFSRVGIYFLPGFSRANLQKHPGKITFQGSILFSRVFQGFPGFSRVVTTLAEVAAEVEVYVAIAICVDFLLSSFLLSFLLLLLLLLEETEKCSPKKRLKTEPKNYRTISLLPLVSKIIERIKQVPVRFSAQIVPQMFAKILKGFDEGKSTSMILIDLQKAFDTIDHKILWNKMRYLGFSRSSINWFRSYLSNRTFTVTWGGTLNPGHLTCGVP